MSTRIILFMFAGRHQNLELNLPLIRRVLEQHPEAEFHVWNLARNGFDRNYLRRLSGDRITVRPAVRSRRGMQAIYWHYVDQDYQDCVFVKIDDDVVFFETERFGALIDAVRDNPGVPISAQIVNNGASTRTHEGLWAEYEYLCDDVIGSAHPDNPLLDVHLSTKYAEAMHDYFFENYEDMLNAPPELIDTSDWLSINVLAYDWQTGCEIADMLDTLSPLEIAGREWRRGDRLGDEGVFNMIPRKILRGFLAAHLSFGPQCPSLEQLDRWRGCYRQIGEQYLENTARVLQF